jgi:host factor-I protein
MRRTSGNASTHNNGLSVNRETYQMSAQKTQNVQDLFLNHLRKHKTPVTVFLVTGAKMQGIITWFDNFSLLLRRDAHSQLVYKRMISTVMPVPPIEFLEGNRERE